MVWEKSTGYDVPVEIRAYMEIMLMLHLAHGALDAAEIENLLITIECSPKLHDLDSRQIIYALGKAWEDIENEGVDSRMRAIAKTLKEKSQRIDAIGIALSIAASDAVIDARERNILEKLQHVLDLTDDNIEESMLRHGNLPLMIFIARYSLHRDYDVVTALEKQHVRNDHLRMQEVSTYLLNQVERRSLSALQKRIH
jgi:tellurite resistance protein